MILLLGDAGYDPTVVQEWKDEGHWIPNSKDPDGWFDAGGWNVYTNVDWGAVLALKTPSSEDTKALWTGITPY